MGKRLSLAVGCQGEFTHAPGWRGDVKTTDRNRNMVVRHHPGVRKAFWIMAVAAVSIAGLALAEEGATRRSSPHAKTQEPHGFYARVASFLGMEPTFIEGLAPEFRREGVKTRDAVLLLLFANKRTQRLLMEEKITKAEAQKNFRDSITEFLEKHRARRDWREAISKELGLDLHNMTKHASNTMREAMRPTVGADRSARAIRAAEPKEVPEDLVRPLLQRLRVRPEVLKQAWGELQSVRRVGQRSAVRLLVLAREKTDRLLEVGAVAREETERVFLESLADFIDQVRSGRTIGWGALASQVGLHSYEIQMETNSIYKGMNQWYQEREKLSGAQAAKRAVPRELSE